MNLHRDGRKIEKSLRKGFEIQNVSRTTATRIADDIIKEARLYMSKEAPNRVKKRPGRYKTGAMSLSWYKRVEPTNKGYRIIIWNNQKYFKYQELGTGRILPALSIPEAANRVRARFRTSMAVKRFSENIRKRMRRLLA